MHLDNISFSVGLAVGLALATLVGLWAVDLRRVLRHRRPAAEPHRRAPAKLDGAVVVDALHRMADRARTLSLRSGFTGEVALRPTLCFALRGEAAKAEIVSRQDDLRSASGLEAGEVTVEPGRDGRMLVCLTLEPVAATLPAPPRVIARREGPVLPGRAEDRRSPTAQALAVRDRPRDLVRRWR